MSLVFRQCHVPRAPESWHEAFFPPAIWPGHRPATRTINYERVHQSNAGLGWHRKLYIYILSKQINKEERWDHWKASCKHNTCLIWKNSWMSISSERLLQYNIIILIKNSSNIFRYDDSKLQHAFMINWIVVRSLRCRNKWNSIDMMS